jgi:hypothetical protein
MESMTRRRAAMLTMPLLAAIAACRGPADAPPAKTDAAKQEQKRGPIERAKRGVEKAQKAAEQRTDDAYDRATKGEGASSRAVPAP